MSPRLSPLRIATALFTVGLIAAAAPAQAALLMTPLQLTGDKNEAEVGDTVDFVLGPLNRTFLEAWAGRTIRIEWQHINGAQDGHGLILGELLLDDQARATFRWTLPEEVRDLNVFVQAKDGEELLALFHVRVGDAEPVAFALGAPGDGSGLEDQTGGPTDGEDDGPSIQKNVPAASPLLLVGALGAIAITLALRRIAKG